MKRNDFTFLTLILIALVVTIFLPRFLNSADTAAIDTFEVVSAFAAAPGSPSGGGDGAPLAPPPPTYEQVITWPVVDCPDETLALGVGVCYSNGDGLAMIVGGVVAYYGQASWHYAGAFDVEKTVLVTDAMGTRIDGDNGWHTILYYLYTNNSGQMVFQANIYRPDGSLRDDTFRFMVFVSGEGWVVSLPFASGTVQSPLVHPPDWTPAS